jgi:transposase
MNTVERLERAGEVLSPGVRAAILALEEENRLLRAELRHALERIRELERRLGRNSTNSSLPPSKDPPGTPRPSKPQSPRKRGAQPGHEPHRRSLLPESRLDRVEDHYPEQCRHCGHRFALFEEAGAVERRQVIELPEIRAHITEHRLHRLRCPCCQEVSAAEAPADVSSAVVFGPFLVALAAAVTVRLRASRRNLRALLGDLLDVEPPCVGQLQALLEEASEATRPACEQIGAALRRSPAVGVDETGWRYRQGRYWLWGATTVEVSYYHLAPGRNRLTLSRLLGEHYSGIVTSDRLSTYGSRDPRRRQHCWAHLLRDFRAWQSRGGVAAEIGAAAEAEGQRIFHLWHRFRRGEVDRAALKRAMRLPKARLTRLLYRGAECGEAKLERTCTQLLLSWEALWSFVLHEHVEPTNNETERALRAGVIWRKTSFGSQSEKGLRFVERLLTVAETCKKQTIDLLGYLSRAIAAHRIGQPAPLLLLAS